MDHYPWKRHEAVYFSTIIHVPNTSSSKAKCWLTDWYHIVYDVTEYARDHPGGKDPLLEVAGADATSAYEDVGHSGDAREIMHNYLVGALEGAQDEEDQAQVKNETTPRINVFRKPDSEGRRTRTESTDTGAPHGVTAMVAVTAGISIPGTLWLLSQSSSSLGGGGFAQGAAASLTLCGLVGTAGALYLQNAMSFGSDFTAQAPHKQSATPRMTDYHPAGALKPSEYVKYALRKKEELAPGIFRFVFSLPNKHAVLGLPIGQHVAVRASIDDHTVVRSYTPVSNNRDLGRLELLVRVYPDGKIGNYLKNLSPGDQVDVRGPKGAMRYRKGLWKSIGMVGGGTGITPLYQIIRAICEDNGDNTQISLVYGNRSEGDMLLRQRLDHFAKVASHKFKLCYTLDEPPPEWKGEKGRVTKQLLEEYMPAAGENTKVLLCGPPGMVKGTKEQLVSLGFREPGAVAKMSDDIFCF